MSIPDDPQEATGIEQGTIALLDECMTDYASRRGYYPRQHFDTEKQVPPDSMQPRSYATIHATTYLCSWHQHACHTQTRVEGPVSVTHVATAELPQRSPWFGRRLPLCFVGCTRDPQHNSPQVAAQDRPSSPPSL